MSSNDAMSNDDVIDELNTLIETCKDGEYGFRTCAEHVKSSQLRQVFTSRADECRQGATELQSLVTRLGGKADTGSSVSGTVHRGWVNLKGMLTGDSDQAALNECERGEDAALERYREAIKKTAVISEKDVSFLYVQSIPAILTAIINGKTSAGTLSAPNTLKARDAGLSLLIDIAQINVPGLHLAYGTTEKSIKSNPNLLYAFMKATAEATMLARQNPAVAKKAIGKFTDTNDASIIDGTYEQFAPYWDAALAVHNEPIQGQLLYLDEREFPRAKDARAGDFIDNSFAEFLKTSGFLQSLGAPKQ